MTLSYLYKPGSTTLDSNGVGTITVKPDANQFWLPTSVHVGTKNPFSPTPACNLYTGPPSVLDYTTLIDFTFAGNNDTTSIVVGELIEVGQGITAQFLGGNPGDTAFMSVIGLSSDVPPPEGIVPGFAGARFSGVGVPAPYQSANRVPVVINTSTLANGATAVLLPATPGRQYHVWSVYAAGITQPADATCQLFSNGSLIAISPSKLVGTPANQFAIPPQPLNLAGSQLAAGADLTLQNVSGGNQYFVGYVAYSY